MQVYTTLQESSLPAAGEAGGKGLSLIRAAQKKFNVPPAIILPNSFFAPWLKQVKSCNPWKAFASGEDLFDKKLRRELDQFVLELAFNDEQKETFTKVIQFMINENLTLTAVRSSSPEEDLKEASFAGIYETRLGVATNELDEAIKDCFAAALTERVMVYKKEHGFDLFNPKVAVIIQKQLACDMAGVAFSLNPVNNCYDEAVINANYGLGKTVVDGSVSPDHFIVDKINHTILEKNLGSKTLAEYLTPGGGSVVQKEKRADEFALSDEQALEVAALAAQVESTYGKPMDIEWAYEKGKLYLLQARPITGYIKLPPKIITAPGEPKNLYLDGMIGEQGLVESLSPLGTGIFSVMVKSIEGAGGIFTPGTGIFYLEAGKAFISIGMLAKITGKKNIPATFRSVDILSAKMLENINLKEYIPKKRPKGLVGSMLKVSLKMIRPLINFIKAYRKPDEYLKLFLKGNQKLEEKLQKESDANMPFDHYCLKLFSRANSYVIETSLPTLIAAERARSQIKKMLRKEEQSIQDQIPYLEQAMENNITIEMGLHLHELATLPDVKQTANVEEFLKKLDQKKLSPEFQEKWDEFMRRYGHRYPTELDIGSARYREKPDEIFMLLKTMESVQKPEMSPRGIYEAGVQKRKETCQTILKHLEKKSKGMIKKFKKNYHILETFSGYREIHKHFLVLAIDKMHQRALQVGHEWVKAKRLDLPEQVFQLEYEQFLEAENNPEMDLRAPAKKNRAFYQEHSHPERPTNLIDSRGKIPSLPPESVFSEDKSKLLATPVSPGVVVGPVRVLTRPDEKPVMPGDILVAVVTNPGWTTLFLNAAGIILENGGTLQHGACVARESCKPCVVGMYQATKILKDGQMVELDGAAGTVRILE